MNISSNDQGYFRLTSFYAAAFLFTKGLELVNIDSVNPRRSQFVFRDAPQRELWMNNFNYGKEGSPEVMVDARKFITAIKTLKEKLYQDKF